VTRPLKSQSRSANERRHRARYVDRATGSEPQRPAAIELLAEAVGNAAALQIRLVMLGTLMIRRALKGGVQAIPTVVGRPDGQLVRDRADLDGKSLAHRASDRRLGHSGTSTGGGDSTRNASATSSASSLRGA
jgi:hypothetical protein